MAGVMATIALLSRYGSKLPYETKIGVNSTSFFSGKFLPRLVFWFMLRVVFGIGCVAGGLCGYILGLGKMVEGSGNESQRFKSMSLKKASGTNTSFGLLFYIIYPPLFFFLSDIFSCLFFL